MIQLRDLLVEIGSATATPYSYDMGFREAWFKTEAGTEYRVDFPWGTDGMNISFHVKKSDGTWDYDVETSESDVYRVMSTIIHILRRAVSEVKPPYITFSAAKADPRRIRLYKSYMRHVPEYREATREEYLQSDMPLDGSAVVMVRKGLLNRLTRFDWTGIKDK